MIWRNDYSNPTNHTYHQPDDRQPPTPAERNRVVVGGADARLNEAKLPPGKDNGDDSPDNQHHAQKFERQRTP